MQHEYGKVTMDLDDKIAALKLAGFEISYAVREDIRYGYLVPFDLFVYPGTESSAYVELGGVAASEDQYGQTSTVRYSNYRVLKSEDESRVVNGDKRYFTDLSYSHITVLGAFVEDLDDVIIGTLCGLATGYPVLDESDLSDLENDEIEASWGEYLDSDLYREIGKREMDEEDAALHGYVIPEDKLTPEQVEFWQDKTEAERRDIFWLLCQGNDYYPEHDGYDVRWDYDQLTDWIVAWIKESTQ